MAGVRARAQLLRGGGALPPAVVGAPPPEGAEVGAGAGFLPGLAEPVFEAFPGRVVNTHPSLLPSFRGAHAVADALAAGVKVTGCTIHLATIEVDDGPILAQEVVPILAGDDEDALHERIKAVEHRLYPEVLAGLLAGGSRTVAGADEARSAAGVIADRPSPPPRAPPSG